MAYKAHRMKILEDVINGLEPKPTKMQKLDPGPKEKGKYTQKKQMSLGRYKMLI